MDIGVFRVNPELVKQNIRKKYQEWRLYIEDAVSPF